MAYSNIGKKTQGKDYNFFTRLPVTWSTFGGADSVNNAGPDIVISFKTQGVIISCEGTCVIEMSLNGNTVHAEFSNLRPQFIYNNRNMSLIWFRLKSGTGSIVLEAWAQE